MTAHPPADSPITAPAAPLPASALTWQSPPAPIAEILDAPATPAVMLSPDEQWWLDLHYTRLMSLESLAEPEVAIAGLRINPNTRGPARSNPYRRITLRRFQSPASEAQTIALPPGAKISNLRWSPQGHSLGFVITEAQGMALWVLELATGQARQLTEACLNGTYGTPYRWLDEQHLLCKVIPPQPGEPPAPPQLPPGPLVQENLGTKAPAMTFTNLLANPHDEALFEYYLTSQLEVVSLEADALKTPQPQRRTLVSPALIDEAIASPDGRYILLKTLHRPFSYQVRAERFPRLTQVLDLSGAVVQTIADLPLDAQRSTKFDAVRAGRRSISWRSDRPSTLYWFEALDGGDPAVECPERDRLCQWAAPFTQPPQPLWTTQHRLRKVLWGREDVALAWERHYDSRLQRLWRLRPDQLALDPGARGAADRLLERSFEDRYSDPGEPLTTEGPYRRPVLRFSPDGHSLYWRGRGASPQGVHPFLRLWSLDALNAQDAQDAQDALTPHPEMQDLWRCQDPYFESVGSLLKDNTRLLLHRQSETHPPNYWISALDSSQPLQPITDFADPAPQFAGLHREVVTYPRADGVQLSGTLYLPPGYDPERDGPLPTMLWVYPAEFKDRNLAGQVTTAQHAFSRPSMASVLFLLTQGYAVLDNPSLPIVGEGEAEPNDTYVEQLLAGAEAAVEYLVGRGVAARDRLGIGGHSYGAFTTANLLAHSRLFRLGIARSGAYNRTLTPFGFQGEQRHFWDAMETYHHMSPFTHAPKIAAPLLLLHGGSDSNIGTYPIQTERLFEALKGLGATVRYVVLPLEDHGYRSREAVGHALWEMVRWCDRYLKG